jgi:23S rRNA pseudouridine1911/1915/1917 synthase
MECRLETGRTHQVRVHLSEQSWPLVGDPTYRPRRLKVARWLAEVLVPDRPMLHAWRLALSHPRDERRVVFEAHPPPDFQTLLQSAGLTWEPSTWPGVNHDEV